jgi:class 3 adenylate cyclase/tetratricopeptide (TPR) repeat protein
VTVLFCDLVGSTALAERIDPEDYREILDRYLELAFAEIYRFEGIVNQLAGDGFMALFGAPIAHEDAPERAVRAGLAIREGLAGLSERLLAEQGFGLRARIGIHTGTVVVGTVGNDLKMDYTAIGDTTNLASRLQTAAEPGSLLVSQATHRLLHDRFRTRRVGPFEVKGRTEPVTAHKVLELDEVLAPLGIDEGHELTPMVGRDQELAQLEACYERARGGMGQVVAIVGDAGSGKSRLVHELKARLADEPLTIFEARCSSLTRGVPYAPWASMMQRFFGIASGESAEDSCARVAEGLKLGAGREVEGCAHICRLLSLPAPDLDGASLDELRIGTFAAVHKLVDAVASRGPVMMIVEDLHWIDDASREMLELAVPHFDGGRAVLVVTHRPDYRPEWRASAALTQLFLRPLAGEDAVEIVRACAGGALPTGLEDRILRRGEGNPFFLEELTRALVEEKMLVRREDRLVATRPIDEVRIPDTIGELLGARLDRLRPAAKRLAQIASVLGRQFLRAELQELVDGETIDVGAELAELVRRGVIHSKGALVGDEFRFGESLTQEFAYESLLLRDRRRLHERVGDPLERSGGDSDPAHAALVAHHLSRGQDRERGVRALIRAAEQVMRVPAFADALRLFREAWELAESVLEADRNAEAPLRFALQATLQIGSISVLYGIVSPGPDERAASRAMELAERLDDAEAMANASVLKGMIAMRRGSERFDEGLAMIEDGVQIARRAGLDLATARHLRALTFAQLADGRFAEAEHSVAAVMAELERLGEAERLSDIFMGTRFMEGRRLFMADEFDRAESYGRETLELARRVDNSTLKSAVSSLLGSISFARREYAEAERRALQAIEIGSAIQNLAPVRSGQAIVLGVRCERGDRTASAAELERLELGLEGGGDGLADSDLIVEVLLELGEIERARRLAESRAAQVGGRLRAARGALALGEVELVLGPGHWEDAERSFERALSLAEEISSRSTRARARLGLARLAAARGATTEEVSRHAEPALAAFRQLGLDRYAERTEQLMARMPATTRRVP